MVIHNQPLAIDESVGKTETGGPSDGVPVYNIGKNVDATVERQITEYPDSVLADSHARIGAIPEAFEIVGNCFWRIAQDL